MSTNDSRTNLKFNPSKLGWIFEDLCSEILAKMGLTAIDADLSQEWRAKADLIVFDKSIPSVVVECRIFIGNSKVVNAIRQLKSSKEVLNAHRAILMTPNIIPPSVILQLEHEFGVEIWDRVKINEIVSDYPNLKFKLNSIVEKIDDRKQTDVDTGNQLIQRLINHPLGNVGTAASQYEELCRDIFIFLFPDELSMPNVRKRTGINVRDITFTINSGFYFWDRITTDFGSRIFVLECKNLTNGPSQKATIQLMKYLFVPAFRTFGVICSRKSAADSAKDMRRVAWLESKKLILFVDDKTCIEMIEMKRNYLDPSEILKKQLDDFIVNLEA